MKGNSDVARGLILKAESDLEALAVMLESGKALDTACFHAQQAAEKHLKAFLSFNDIIFPKTHSIEELVGLCATIDAQFADLADETVFLTDYAVELRYDVGFWPEKEEVEAAFEAASKIRQLVLSKLPEEMHP